METVGNPKLERGATPDEQWFLGCEPERWVVIDAMRTQLSYISAVLLVRKAATPPMISKSGSTVFKSGPEERIW